MKEKIFTDTWGDSLRMTMDSESVFLSGRAGDDPGKMVGSMELDADTAEALGWRLLKAAKKLRKAEANGET